MIRLPIVPVLEEANSEGSFIDKFTERVSEIGNKLVPNIWEFLVQLIALIILIIIVIVVAYKPVKKLLKARADFVESNIETAKNNAAISEQNIKQSEEKIIASRKQANEIIEQAKVTADNKQKEMIEEAEKEIAKMKLNAEKDIEKSRQDALNEIRNEMVDVALSASELVLKREINKEDDSQIVEEFIKNLD